jgi:SAM-dependent methyltransferase
MNTFLSDSRRDVAPGTDYFDAMFQRSDDPWSFKTRWYEARKRALTMASLPQARYASAYEPGCANGELSLELAGRCDRLLCSDGVARAVELARQRLAGQDHVRVVQSWVPASWPDERFDLIVISELGYFLTADALDNVAARVRSSLLPGGTVVSCHWRWPIDGCELTGDVVSTRLTAALNLPLHTSVLDRDFRLDLWFGEGRSVGQLEGLV